MLVFVAPAAEWDGMREGGTVNEESYINLCDTLRHQRDGAWQIAGLSCMVNIVFLVIVVALAVRLLATAW